jgi:hypothetical protein
VILKENVFRNSFIDMHVMDQRLFGGCVLVGWGDEEIGSGSEKK